jgi:hypothetical protein
VEDPGGGGGGGDLGGDGAAVSDFAAGGVETCFGSGGSDGSTSCFRPGPMWIAGAHAGTSTGAGHAVSSSAGFGGVGAQGGDEGWPDCDG